jgi:hypothetical protein
LFRYRDGIIHLDAKIPNRAFDLGVTEQELDSPQIASTSIDQRCLVRRNECVPNCLASAGLFIDELLAQAIAGGLVDLPQGDALSTFLNALGEKVKALKLESGIGREFSLECMLDSYTQRKNVTINLTH